MEFTFQGGRWTTNKKAKHNIISGNDKLFLKMKQHERWWHER